MGVLLVGVEVALGVLELGDPLGEADLVEVALGDEPPVGELLPLGLGALLPPGDGIGPNVGDPEVEGVGLPLGLVGEVYATGATCGTSSDPLRSGNCGTALMTPLKGAKYWR